MSDYKPIPVESARQLAKEFGKSIVIICAWDAEHELLHTTTYGKEPQDKINAAYGGDLVTKALGFDLGKRATCEDFRTLDAAINAQLRDLAPGIMHALRSYQSGNASPDLAGDMADLLEHVMPKEKGQTHHRAPGP